MKKNSMEPSCWEVYSLQGVWYRVLITMMTLTA